MEHEWRVHELDGNFVLHMRPYKEDNGRVYMEYKLYDLELSDSEPLFEGNDFSPSPLISIDGIDSALSLCSFLTLGEYDIEDDYFKDYTERQIEWRDSDRREELNLYVILKEDEDNGN